MINTLLHERAKTHGDWEENATTCHDIVTSLNRHPRTDAFNPVIREAWHMIAMKLARSAAQPYTADHWDDIAGYATLVASWLRKQAAK